LALGPLSAYYAKSASGAVHATDGYGPLVNKGDLWLPADFNYQVLSRQGTPMSDGQPTPGVFDGMGAYPGNRGETILIRNHENRERAGEQKVITGPAFEYDPLAFGGNTKLEVRKTMAGEDGAGNQLYTYEVVRDFAILGGTSTNCAGGLRSPHWWLSCEEVVKRTGGKKHGYIFEIDAHADGPVPAIPVLQAGRRSHGRRRATSSSRRTETPSSSSAASPATATSTTSRRRRRATRSSAGPASTRITRRST